MPNPDEPIPAGANPSRVWPDYPAHSLVLQNLRDLAEQQPFAWRPFFPGVNIHWLYRDGDEGPAAALIRFDPGARVPLHEHRGFEHIFMLRGSQTDENGVLHAGGLVVHAPGTRHSVFSEDGCLVLAIYEKRGRFIPAGEAATPGPLDAAAPPATEPSA